MKQSVIFYLLSFHYASQLQLEDYCIDLNSKIAILSSSL